MVMRYGENPREVIDRVKAKITSLESELGGIKIIGVYDRTQLIGETIATLTTALSEETLVTIVVMLLFLLHLRASIIIAVTLPMAVLMSFIAMHVFGVDANIMSLAGIAIAIGTMVDMGIIVLENVYDSLSEWESEGSPGGADQRLTVIRDSALEVIPAVITAVTTTIVSFLPVFLLTGRDHRLFTPLAWTKTYALASSLIVAVVVVPMLCQVLLRSSRPKIATRLFATLGLGAIATALVGYVWGHHIAEHIGVPQQALLVGSAVFGSHRRLVDVSRTGSPD